MSKADLDALHAAAAAAREGMGLEERPAQDEGGEQQETVVAPEVDSPEEETQAPEVEQTPESETETEEGQPAESPEGDEGEEAQPGTSVYKQLNEIRSQKRESDAVARKILSAIGAGTVEEAVAAIQKLKENQPLPEEFSNFAKEHGIEDPKVLKGMYDLFSAETKRETGEAIASLREELGGIKGAVEQDHSKREWEESLSAMNSEWQEQALPVIENTWKPDSAKVGEAHKLMAELAHSEKYHDKELEYILYKERPQFEAIFGAPKRKTMLPARGAARSLVPDKPAGTLTKPDGSHESIMAARAQLAKIKNSNTFSEDSENI